tara:strand:+ start:8755 stop:9123 length:369 start_codon:yes stop_codon:yes gene_type:complete
MNDQKTRSCQNCKFAEWSEIETDPIHGWPVTGLCTFRPELPPLPDCLTYPAPQADPIKKTDGETCPTFAPIEPERPPCPHEWKLDSDRAKTIGGRRCQICRTFQVVDPRSGVWTHHREITTG